MRSIYLICCPFSDFERFPFSFALMSHVLLCKTKNICLSFSLLPPARLKMHGCGKNVANHSILRLVHGSFNCLTETITVLSALLASSFMFPNEAGATTVGHRFATWSINLLSLIHFSSCVAAKMPHASGQTTS